MVPLFGFILLSTAWKEIRITNSWLAVIYTRSGEIKLKIEAFHPQKCEHKCLISTDWPFQLWAQTC